MNDTVRRAMAWMIGGAAVLLAAIAMWSGREGELSAAGPFPDPKQEELAFRKPLAAPEGYEIGATDSYEVEAVILSRERYWSGKEADLSPVDFLLGWGLVAQEPVLHEVKWSQGGRWGHYRYEGKLSMPVQELEKSSANTHIIPADDAVREEVLDLKRGDSVRLEGFLVKVEDGKGWKWESSRTRTDTGGGSCEVFYVTRVQRK